MQRLAGASEVEIAPSYQIEGAVSAVTESARMFLPLSDLIDREKELERLNREREVCQKDIDFISKKLSNEKFVSKAPEKIVAQEKQKLVNAQERMEKIMESIRALH